MTEEIERQDLKVKTLLRSRDTNATAVTMTYLEGRKDGVALDGNVLGARRTRSYPGWGHARYRGRWSTCIVHPGQRADNASLEEAQRRLQELLESARSQ